MFICLAVQNPKSFRQTFGVAAYEAIGSLYGGDEFSFSLRLNLNLKLLDPHVAILDCINQGPISFKHFHADK